MSYEYYERMRTGGDPRSAHRASDMPEGQKELLVAEIDRLACREGYDDEIGQVFAYSYRWAWQHERCETLSRKTDLRRGRYSWRE
ncbi:hypothetical protein SAMN05216328_12786 [Ensifer sp. YR511]|nr:hypothetical protein SAMN05216328_12786 [Ensifer sp. YR511]